MTTEPLKAPFVWFGGKSKVADLVWERFGVCANYIEPFFGSGAVLLRRPAWSFPPDSLATETINDIDAHVANLWRSIQRDPDATAAAADRPVNELDLHAVGDGLFCKPTFDWPMPPREFAAWIREDEANFDPSRAGSWAWFVSNWIGGLPLIEECGGQGGNGENVHRKRPHLGNMGQGVSRKLPHLGNMGKDEPIGECERRRNVLLEWFGRLADRFRNVRVCCGDWSRICGPSVTGVSSPCAVFLDPPYSAEAGRDNELYSHDCGAVAHDVREWCEANGANRDLRICLCGYAGEGHDGLVDQGWSVVEWKTQGGYGNNGSGAGKENKNRERLWFSPGCLAPRQGGLFQ